jgi:Ca2+/Na+ antiporter
MSALVLEKYLVTLTGFVVFNFLIPVVCVLLLLFFLLNREAYLHGAMRLLAFSLALFLLVPVSVRLSRFIEDTYQDLQVAVSSALEQDQSDLYVEDASASVSESPAAEESPVAPPVQTPAEESQAWWQKALNGLTGRAEEAGSAVQEQIDKIKEDIAGIAQEVTVAPEKLSRLLNHYIEVVSVLIVTSCVIPVLVFLAFYALVKMLFNLDASPLAGLVRERFQK